MPLSERQTDIEPYYTDAEVAAFLNPTGIRSKEFMQSGEGCYNN